MEYYCNKKQYRNTTRGFGWFGEPHTNQTTGIEIGGQPMGRVTAVKKNCTGDIEFGGFALARGLLRGGPQRFEGPIPRQRDRGRHWFLFPLVVGLDDVRRDERSLGGRVGGGGGGLSGGRRPGVPVVVVPLVLRRHGGEKKEVWNGGGRWCKGYMTAVWMLVCLVAVWQEGTG